MKDEREIEFKTSISEHDFYKMITTDLYYLKPEEPNKRIYSPIDRFKDKMPTLISEFDEDFSINHHDLVWYKPEPAAEITSPDQADRLCEISIALRAKTKLLRETSQD